MLSERPREHHDCFIKENITTVARLRNPFSAPGVAWLSGPATAAANPAVWRYGLAVYFCLLLRVLAGVLLQRLLLSRLWLTLAPFHLCPLSLRGALFAPACPCFWVNSAQHLLEGILGGYGGGRPASRFQTKYRCYSMMMMPGRSRDDANRGGKRQLSLLS